LALSACSSASLISDTSLEEHAESANRKMNKYPVHLIILIRFDSFAKNRISTIAYAKEGSGVTYAWRERTQNRHKKSGTAQADRLFLRLFVNRSGLLDIFTSMRKFFKVFMEFIR